MIKVTLEAGGKKKELNITLDEGVKPIDLIPYLEAEIERFLKNIKQ